MTHWCRGGALEPLFLEDACCLDALILYARQEARIQCRFDGRRRHRQLSCLLHRPLTCSPRQKEVRAGPGAAKPSKKPWQTAGSRCQPWFQISSRLGAPNGENQKQEGRCLPVPFMPVLSKILSTRKPSPLGSLNARISALIWIRKLSNSDCRP